MGNLGGQQPGSQDEVRFGRRRPRRTSPWLPRLATAAVVAVAVIVVALRLTGGPGQSHKAARPRVTVTTVGHSLLGVRAGWHLFARGRTFVADIQLARGRITTTAVPPLVSNETDSFVVGPHEAIVRSYDFSGYLIPDGKPARRLPGLLAGNGPLIPGPEPGEFWAMSSGSNPSFRLVTSDGRLAGPVVSFPPGQVYQPATASDGRGYLLAFTPSGRTFAAGPTWDVPLHADVVAVGPPGWLVLRCQTHPCRYGLISPVTFTQRLLPGMASPAAFWAVWPTGVIAPGGGEASVLIARPQGRYAVELIDLATGAETVTAVEFAQLPGNAAMAWSPDGRWLFVADHGAILAVSAATGAVTTLPVKLPQVSQVVVRPAAAP